MVTAQRGLKLPNAPNQNILLCVTELMFPQAGGSSNQRRCNLDVRYSGFAAIRPGVTQPGSQDVRKINLETHACTFYNFIHLLTASAASPHAPREN